MNLRFAVHLGPLLAELADGRASEADQRRAEQHLAGCDACRQALSAQRYAKALLAPRGCAGASSVTPTLLEQRLRALADPAEDDLSAAPRERLAAAGGGVVRGPRTRHTLAGVVTLLAVGGGAAYAAPAGAGERPATPPSSAVPVALVARIAPAGVPVATVSGTTVSGATVSGATLPGTTVSGATLPVRRGTAVLHLMAQLAPTGPAQAQQPGAVWSATP